MERKFFEDLNKRLLLLKGNRSIKEFAEVLNLPVSTVYYYLNGRKPTISFLLRVSKKLNVNEGWLFTGKGSIFKEEEEELFKIEDVIDFLKKNWDTWANEKRHCFERYFKELFPEFELWKKERHSR